MKYCKECHKQRTVDFDMYHQKIAELNLIISQLSKLIITENESRIAEFSKKQASALLESCIIGKQALQIESLHDEIDYLKRLKDQ